MFFEPQLISNMDDSVSKNIGEQPPFTSYAPDEMNAEFWAVFPVTERPYFYSREQGKGKGIEFEPSSNFDCKNLDLSF